MGVCRWNRYDEILTRLVAKHIGIATIDRLLWSKQGESDYF